MVSGFGLLMIIFASMIFLTGLYMYKGHKLVGLEWRAAYRNLTIDNWKKIGKYTMIVSPFVLALGIIGIIFHW